MFKTKKAKVLGCLGVGAVVVLVGYFGLRLLLMFLLTGSLTAPDYKKIALGGQPTVQAIYEFKQQTGLWPLSIDELVPEYLPSRPSNWWMWQWPALYRPAGMPHTGIVYNFRPPDVGWSSGGDFAKGPISLPKPPTTRPAPTPEQQFKNAMALLDARIRREPGDFARYHSRITYLVHQKHPAEAIDFAQQAEKRFPDQWWPPMVIAQLSEGADKIAAVTAFSLWADHNPNFNNYWYLADYYRLNKQPVMALKALEQAAAYSVLSRSYDRKVPEFFYFSAAAYACKMQKYDLTLKICDRWGGNDSLAIRAGACLGLGRIAEAQSFALKAIEQQKKQAGWAGDLDRLDAAAKAGDTKFIYDADKEVTDGPWVDLFESWGDDE